MTEQLFVVTEVGIRENRGLAKRCLFKFCFFPVERHPPTNQNSSSAGTAEENVVRHFLYQTIYKNCFLFPRGLSGSAALTVLLERMWNGVGTNGERLIS